MPELELFQAALGLALPWRVVGSDFDASFVSYTGTRPASVTGR